MTASQNWGTRPDERSHSLHLRGRGDAHSDHDFGTLHCQSITPQSYNKASGNNNSKGRIVLERYSRRWHRGLLQLLLQASRTPELSLHASKKAIISGVILLRTLSPADTRCFMRIWGGWTGSRISSSSSEMTSISTDRDTHV